MALPLQHPQFCARNKTQFLRDVPCPPLSYPLPDISFLGPCRTSTDSSVFTSAPFAIAVDYNVVEAGGIGSTRILSP